MATAAYATGERGMGMGRVLSGAFRVVGAAPVPMFGISLVLVALPSVATSLLFGTGAAAATAVDPNSIVPLLPTLASTAIVWWVLYMAAQAMLFGATVAAIDGHPRPIGELAAAALRALPALVGLAILMTVLVWIGLALFVVPGVMLMLMWAVAAPALVVERVGVFAAMRRSRFLTKGQRWRVLGLVLVVFAIYMVASMAVGLGSLAANGFAGGAVVRRTPTIAASIASATLQTTLVTIWSAIQAALYVELRDTKEGPATERLADIFA